MRSRVAVPEPVPQHLQHLDFPEYGGMLVFNYYGIAHCPVCDWQGIPTMLDGIFSSHCPVCNVDDTLPPAEPVRVLQRNAPCPCGSGTKAKRCPCEGYSV